MNLYQAQFSDDLDLPASSGPERTVLIASTPRCGSHMIGHAMARTGLLGVPFEYCNRDNISAWMQQLDTGSPDATLRAIRARRTTGNGVFGIKAHFDHCEVIGGPPMLFRALPQLCVVHMRRADVMRQAVSYAVARQTGVWIKGQEPTSDTANYDPSLIAGCLDDIALQNAGWATAFADAGIRPLNIYYEDAAQDLRSAVTAIARFAGVISHDENIGVEAVTERQARSARTEDWIERYAQDRRRHVPIAGRLGKIVLRAIGK